MIKVFLPPANLLRDCEKRKIASINELVCSKMKLRLDCAGGFTNSARWKHSRVWNWRELICRSFTLFNDYHLSQFLHAIQNCRIHPRERGNAFKGKQTITARTNSFEKECTPAIGLR